MSKVEVLNEKELTTVVGGKNGKNVDWVKCYVGGVASAVAGFATGGPVGYWAGAGVGYATFCR